MLVEPLQQALKGTTELNIRLQRFYFRSLDYQEQIRKKKQESSKKAQELNEIEEENSNDMAEEWIDTRILFFSIHVFFCEIDREYIVRLIVQGL